MVKDAEKNAAEDKKRREEIDARNRLDSLTYEVEKNAKEWSDKLTPELKTRLDARGRARAQGAPRRRHGRDPRGAGGADAAFQEAGQSFYAQQQSAAGTPAGRAPRRPRRGRRAPPSAKPTTSSKRTTRSWTKQEVATGQRRGQRAGAVSGNRHAGPRHRTIFDLSVTIRQRRGTAVGVSAHADARTLDGTHASNIRTLSKDQRPMSSRTLARARFGAAVAIAFACGLVFASGFDLTRFGYAQARPTPPRSRRVAGGQVARRRQQRVRGDRRARDAGRGVDPGGARRRGRDASAHRAGSAPPGLEDFFQQFDPRRSSAAGGQRLRASSSRRTATSSRTTTSSTNSDR